MFRSLLIACSLVVLEIPALVTSAHAGPQLIASWGQTGPGALLSPYGIALDGGYAYVSDQYHFRIVKFTLDGQYVTAWGSQGSGPGQFGQTIGLALDGQGRLYVVDYGNNRVQVFTTEGAYLLQWGSYGTGPGQFKSPRRLTVDMTGLVQVTDYGNDRMQAFTREGVFVSAWGVGEVASPAGIAQSQSGTFLVTEESGFADCVTLYDPAYTRLSSFGGPGSADGQFGGPSGIAVDASGRVFVADHLNNRVQQFTESGVFVQAWGSGGSGPGNFNGPVDVAVSETGDIYVVDLGNNRIQVFRDMATPIAQTTWGEVKARFR